MDGGRGGGDEVDGNHVQRRHSVAGQGQRHLQPGGEQQAGDDVGAVEAIDFPGPRIADDERRAQHGAGELAHRPPHQQLGLEFALLVEAAERLPGGELVLGDDPDAVPAHEHGGEVREAAQPAAVLRELEHGPGAFDVLPLQGRLVRAHVARVCDVHDLGAVRGEVAVLGR